MNIEELKRLLREEKSTVAFWVGLIGAIASIIGLAVITIPAVLSSRQPTPSLFALAFLIFNISILGLLIYVVHDRARLFGEYEKAQNGLKQQLKQTQAAGEIDKQYRMIVPEIHQICHDLRDSEYEIINESELSVEGARLKMNEGCFHLINRVKNIFQKTTGRPCSTCLKLIAGDNSVQTQYRDIDSYNRGERRNEPVKISENTDFDRIYNHEERYFLCNDLAIYPGYQNSHADWAEYYRSTIVWPIRGAFDAGREKRHIFGFLCVDSLVVDAFDEETAPWIGAAVVDVLYCYFERLSEKGVFEG